MVAIKTKYIPASNVKGSRIVAECGNKRVIISYPDHTHHGDETHFEAVKAFIAKHAPEWYGIVWVCGYLEKTHEYVFTYVAQEGTEIGDALLTQESAATWGIFVASADPLINEIAKAQRGAK